MNRQYDVSDQDLLRQNVTNKLQFVFPLTGQQARGFLWSIISMADFSKHLLWGNIRPGNIRTCRQ